MAENQRNLRSSEQEELRNQNNESMNTSSGNIRKEEQRESNQPGSGRSYDYGSGSAREHEQQQGINPGGQQNASASRGGTADMDDESIAGAGRDTRTQRGSGLTTKNTVTGSDFDGQNSL